MLLRLQKATNLNKEELSSGYYESYSNSSNSSSTSSTTSPNCLTTTQHFAKQQNMLANTMSAKNKIESAL